MLSDMSALRQDVEQLVEDYFKWLKNETCLNISGEDENFVVISTPHLDRHSDYLEIIVERDGDGYELSDDGYILADLKASGCSINTPKRKKLFAEILRGFNVRNEQNVLRTTANNTNFSFRKHSLLQAMLAVNDMFFTVAPNVQSFFLDHVRNWMRESHILSIENVDFIGRSGFNHKFEFSMPTKDRTERYVKALNNLDKQTALNIIVAWEDIKSVRPTGASASVILNDQAGKVINIDVLAALIEYGITPVLWSEREKVVSEWKLN